MKIFILTLMLSMLMLTGYAQSVGIANTAITPDASSILEVQSTSKGMLIPRVALTATNAAGPVASPATSLLVYNTATAGVAPNNVTPGYYYNAGTPAAPNWTRLLGGREAWLTTGNLGTSPATNWLGTNDAQDFVTRTNNTERTRVLSAGNILFNRATALYATDLFEAQGNATFPDAINGYTDQANGTGVFGGNTTATGAGTGAGVYGLSSQTGGAGVIGDGLTFTAGTAGLTGAANYDGVIGINTTATGAGGGAGVYGSSSQTGAAGVWGDGNTTTRGVIGITNNATYAGVQGQNSNLDGDGMYAVNSAVSGAGIGTGIYARSDQSGGAGVFGVTANNAGIGTIGLNGAAAGAGSGIGVYGQTAQGGGAAAGVYGYNSNAAGAAMIAYNGAASGANSGDGIYAYTAQSTGMGVSAWSGHASGTAVLGGGNNSTAYYMPEGSGGAFTGRYYGAYGTSYDSLTNRTSYTQNAAGVFGKAVYNRNATGNFYHFGVYGQYFDNRAGQHGRRSGGVLGYGANEGSGAWGSLGYVSSGSVLYGGYFTSPAAYTTGGGKSMEEESAQVGIGVEGGFMGGHINGSQYGLVVQANRAAMLIEGETYATSYYAVLNKTDDGEYIPSYATVSTSPKIYASGTGTMVNGVAKISFDQSFTEIASPNEQVIVTVTAMGPNSGLYVEFASNSGFTVKENNTNEMKGAANLTFSWIAIASVKQQETPQVPDELKTANFHNNLNGFVKNEANTTDQQFYLWWDGSSIRFDEPQAFSDYIIPTMPSSSKSAPQESVEGFQMRLNTNAVELRNPTEQISGFQNQKTMVNQNGSITE